MKRDKDSIPPNLSELLEVLLPPETAGHLTNAGMELLLAMRSWLDANVLALEKIRRETAKSPLKKVEVK